MKLPLVPTKIYSAKIKTQQQKFEFLIIHLHSSVTSAQGSGDRRIDVLFKCSYKLQHCLFGALSSSLHLPQILKELLFIMATRASMPIGRV